MEFLIVAVAVIIIFVYNSIIDTKSIKYKLLLNIRQSAFLMEKFMIYYLIVYEENFGGF